eukprot:3704587-Amphidinium_carterae.1
MELIEFQGQTKKTTSPAKNIKNVFFGGGANITSCACLFNNGVWQLAGTRVARVGQAGVVVFASFRALLRRAK